MKITTKKAAYFLAGLIICIALPKFIDIAVFRYLISILLGMVIVLIWD